IDEPAVARAGHRVSCRPEAAYRARLGALQQASAQACRLPTERTERVRNSAGISSGRRSRSDAAPPVSRPARYESAHGLRRHSGHDARLVGTERATPTIEAAITRSGRHRSRRRHYESGCRPLTWIDLDYLLSAR